MDNNLYAARYGANYPPPHPIHQHPNLLGYLSGTTPQRVRPLVPTGSLFDDITIGVREPTLPAPASYETWAFNRGVDPESGEAGFTLERPNSRSFFDTGPPGSKKSFRVNVSDNCKVFMVKEEAARNPRDRNRYVEFFRMPAQLNLQEGVLEKDGFKHVTLDTANLLPDGASQIDVGYWYAEDEDTGMKWHEFKVTWPGGTPDGDEEVFQFSWKQRPVADPGHGVESEYCLQVTHSPGAMVPLPASNTFFCELRKLRRSWNTTSRVPVELEINVGVLGAQRQRADRGRIWENMRWAVIVWSAFYVYGHLGA